MDLGRGVQQCKDESGERRVECGWIQRYCLDCVRHRAPKAGARPGEQASPVRRLGQAGFWAQARARGGKGFVSYCIGLVKSVLGL